MSATAIPPPHSIVWQQTYTAAHTFLRMPSAKDAAGHDVAILGIPFDLATTNRPGARYGAAAIRAASALLADLKSYPGGYDPLSFLNTVDLGDVFLDIGNPLTIPSAIEEAARSVIEAGAFLCSLGGDHFVSYPLIREHAKRYGPLALVHFDAHTDTWPSANTLDQPVELNHGIMFSRAIDEGLIVPERSVQIGIRTWVDDAMGMTILDNEFVEESTPTKVASLVREATTGHPCYLTVDIDCLDPAFAPGTGTPVVGGLTPLKLLQLLRAISDLDIVGFDMVEVSPGYDPSGVTALNAATIVYEQLCRLARARGAKERRYPAPPA